MQECSYLPLELGGIVFFLPQGGGGSWFEKCNRNLRFEMKIEGPYFDRELYAELLLEVVLLSILVLIPWPETIMIVHDNCPIHKSSKVQGCFTDHPDVVHLFWPAR